MSKVQDSELLNIKQAAQFLNVSEVSLRRWTGSGRLACLRVGAKGERRFRRTDLEAFLQLQAAVSPVPESQVRTGCAGHVLLEGIVINHGSHLCCVYEGDPGRVKLAVPLLAEGLDRGELCFLVATGAAQHHLLDTLEKSRPGVRAEMTRGNLHLVEGADSATAMYDYFANAFVAGTRSGNRSLRVVGDMAWVLDKKLCLDELIDFELRYNQFLARQFPLVSLCQYDARRFSGLAVLNALKCHEDTFAYPMSRFLT
ncbi:MEDS domain-containing protein [Azoarcus sp. DN11]|uniref:MEDS domain-containing protein n=1 Tax=Azoarcus sp. DN11 TaxID=356837 RepID=UPI0013E390EF|nr:MEDS domain-containing protein [Azoarcus sp. DN11]